MNIEEHVFFDESICYSHADFNNEVIADNCIYLDVEHDVWNGNLDGWSKGEVTAMISRSDAVAIARKFKLTPEDLNE